MAHTILGAETLPRPPQRLLTPRRRRRHNHLAQLLADPVTTTNVCDVLGDDDVGAEPLDDGVDLHLGVQHLPATMGLWKTNPWSTWTICIVS